MSAQVISTPEIRRPMATEWYCRIMNEEIGPLSSRQLLEKVRTGQVKHDTLVRKDNSQWVTASQVNGLLDAVDKTATRRLCPYCGHDVDRPPTTCPGCSRKLVITVSSRLTNAGMRKPNRPRKNRHQQAEELREYTERRELLKYAVLLIVWLLLLLATPYLLHFASNGQLVFQGRWAAIAVGVVSVFVAFLYYFMSRFL